MVAFRIRSPVRLHLSGRRESRKAARTSTGWRVDKCEERCLLSDSGMDGGWHIFGNGTAAAGVCWGHSCCLRTKEAGIWGKRSGGAVVFGLWHIGIHRTFGVWPSFGYRMGRGAHGMGFGPGTTTWQTKTHRCCPDPRGIRIGIRSASFFYGLGRLFNHGGKLGGQLGLKFSLLSTGIGSMDGRSLQFRQQWRETMRNPNTWLSYFPVCLRGIITTTQPNKQPTFLRSFSAALVYKKQITV
ncbi:hypothetical protein B0I37DRAFT_40055 [Chaetomium sp. MPI-CAGE-AT-0009]|nr:hypothetical protein B0I37DRAFT_40055 [Chaetomium sp. MPI-CAGE-AT-0009]